MSFPCRSFFRPAVCVVRRGCRGKVHSRSPTVAVASPAATSPASTRTGHHVSGSRCGQSSSAFGAVFAPDAAHFAAPPSPPPACDCCKVLVSPLLAPLSGAAGSSPLGGICHNPLQSQGVAFFALRRIPLAGNHPAQQRAAVPRSLRDELIRATPKSAMANLLGGVLMFWKARGPVARGPSGDV